MAKKRVIIACGNGVATSTVVASKVKDYCDVISTFVYRAGIEVTQFRMIELHDKADDYDLVVTTGKFSDPDIKTPCIMAISLLTGINEEPTLQKIVAALQD